MTFFQPFRIKTGCVTLMMALVFMCGWIRSLSFFEEIYSPCGTQSAVFLASGDGFIACGHMRANTPDYLLTKPDWHSISGQGLCRALKRYHWIGPFVGFGCGVIDVDKDNVPDKLESNVVVAAPYWSIVLPLVFISACLLLIKPRTSTEKRIH